MIAGPGGAAEEGGIVWGNRVCGAAERPLARHRPLRRLCVTASGLAAALVLAGCGGADAPGQQPTRITVSGTAYHWPPVHTPPPGGEKLTRDAVRTELSALLADSGVRQVNELLPERVKPCGVLLLGQYAAKAGDTVPDKVFAALARRGWQEEEGGGVRAGETRWYFKGSWTLTTDAQPMIPVGQGEPSSDVKSFNLSAEYPCGSPSPSSSGSPSASPTR